MEPKLLHHTLRSILLFAFALYIFRLERLGLLSEYVEPEMARYVYWAAFGLLAVALEQAYSGFRTFAPSTAAHTLDCGCGEDHTDRTFRLREALLYGLFALPLLAGMLLEAL